MIFITVCYANGSAVDPSVTHMDPLLRSRDTVCYANGSAVDPSVTHMDPVTIGAALGVALDDRSNPPWSNCV